jgi:hypothetical protein
VKYYKILDENECHNGLQYKTGLNIDPIPFNPSGECQPGGMYFTREFILYFLNWGVWIREVTLPPDAQVYKDPFSVDKWKADKIILGERRRITSEVIKELVEEGAYINVFHQIPLRWSISEGDFDLFTYLVEKGADVSSNYSGLLLHACECNKLNIVKYLLEQSFNVISDEMLRDSLNDSLNELGDDSDSYFKDIRVVLKDSLAKLDEQQA